MFAARGASFSKSIPPVKGSVYFDGTGDYLEPQTATSASNFGTGDYTAEYWYYPLASGQQNCIDNFGNSGVAIYRDNSPGYMHLYVGGNVVNSSVAITNNSWWHIAVVRQGSGVRMYINGVLQPYPGTDSTNYGGGANYPRIGLAFNGSVGVNGYLSNVRLVKSALYGNSNFTPSATPLTAVSGTSLLTCQSPTTITDASSNNLTVTAYGNAVASSTSPF